ncbi:MAG: succinylglutamate desuccinylase/aspartoacylase family protein, partial [Thermoanaerobaculia bacterium]|nr:succinylglutamate desuccinylase/aspartoacylase family protein [Thermoanaerobaculia bacterium]
MTTFSGTKRQRLIGELGERGRGPLLVAIGSIHGNEPAGTSALDRLFETLERESPAVNGRIVGLVGNRRALDRRTRFIERDLNRVWRDNGQPEIPEGSPERLEHRELADKIETELAAARGKVAFIDLHSTSAEGPPFSVISDSLANRDLAMELGIPVVLGLEESIQGSLLSYLGERGYVAVGVEGGQHDDPLTVDYHEAALWVALDSMGIVRVEESRLRDMRLRLSRASEDLPEVVELVYRHRIEDEESFEMAAPFRGFDRIRKGELLAYEAAEPLTAPRDGVIMLPRYQRLGDDGYFIARPIRPVWLGISTVLRRTPIHRLLPLLPKIRRDPLEKGTLLIRRDPLHRLAVMAMHLLGYRRWPDRDGELVF